MNKIDIIPLDAPRIKQAAQLASKVFPYRGGSVRLSFWAYKHQKNRLTKAMLRLAGYALPMEYYAAVNEAGEVCGVAGIYSYQKDAEEAIWMSWFCVDPQQRGQGIGKQLIAHSIEMARARNKKWFRLYTSTLKNEAAAQALYEAYDFRITREKHRLICKLLYRELALSSV